MPLQYPRPTSSPTYRTRPKRRRHLPAILGKHLKGTDTFDALGRMGGSIGPTIDVDAVNPDLASAPNGPNTTYVFFLKTASLLELTLNPSCFTLSL